MASKSLEVLWFLEEKKGKELAVSPEYPTCVPLLLQGLEAKRGEGLRRTREPVASSGKKLLQAVNGTCGAAGARPLLHALVLPVRPSVYYAGFPLQEIQPLALLSSLAATLPCIFLSLSLVNSKFMQCSLKPSLPKPCLPPREQRGGRGQRGASERDAGLPPSWFVGWQGLSLEMGL